MIILHGDNQVASRNQLLLLKEAAKKSGLTIVDLAGDQLTLPDLVATVESTSLFGDSNSVFIDGFFSRRASNDKKKISDYLLASVDKHITIWESKDVSSQLKDFPSNIASNYSYPKYIFDFLDHPTFESFHQAISVSPVEQIFASLVTRLHKVLLGAGRFPKSIDPKQAVADLLAIDYSQKTSQSPYDLTTALEIWLTKL